MRAPFVSFIVVAGIFSSVFPALAQIGPCVASEPVPAGQICEGPSGASFYYRLCTSGTDCTSTQTCRQPTGISRPVCANPDPEAPASSASTEEAPPEPEFVPITPQLGVPIPGYTPEAPTREGG